MARLTRRRVAAAITLTSAAIAIAACSAGGTSATSPGSTDVSAGIRPEHIVQAPKNILASAGPQPNGTTAMPSYCFASAPSMPATTASAVSAVPSWM